MQSRLIHSLLFRHYPASAVGMLGLLLAAGQPAQASVAPVVLSLTPLTSTAAFGSTVSFTVNLTGGTNLAGFDFNILLADPTSLSFVNPPLLASANTNPFTSLIMDSLVSPSDLRGSYGDLSGTAINNPGTTVLGTFQVKVLKTLTTAGTTVSFGAVGSANIGGSEVDDATVGHNVLTGTTGATLTPSAAIPEASQGAIFGLCLLGLGGMILRARCRAI